MALAHVIGTSTLTSAAPFRVCVNQEPVWIPYRIHHDEPTPAAMAHLSPVQHSIMACIYSRHHDGYVRQRQLNVIVGQTQDWVVPFVVQLLGEYVVEIIVAIRDGLSDLDVAGTPTRAAYGQFAAANPAFITATRQRASSYWNCYHRTRYTDRRDYPSLPILASIRTAGHDTTTALPQT